MGVGLSHSQTGHHEICKDQSILPTDGQSSLGHVGSSCTMQLVSFQAWWLKRNVGANCFCGQLTYKGRSWCDQCMAGVLKSLGPQNKAGISSLGFQRGWSSPDHVADE